LIILNNINYDYEDYRALENISLSLKKGEKAVLLGSNGSGKSTLLKILAALYFCKEGEYRFCDEVVTKKSLTKEFRKRVGIVFQNPESMIFNPTVRDEIAFSLREFGFDNVDERVQNIADKFGISALLDKNPLYLSGGEKQKVILAAILVYEPELLLLDEPTAAMDPKTTGWLIDLLLDLEITLIVATHDLSLAYEISDRAIVIDESHKKVYDGDIEKLYEDLDLLIQANLIHKHRHKHKDFSHSHYHKHY
jgi:cobalt/nickel transport system ATP-binding protein